MTYKWWQYNDAGSYQGNVTIKKSSKKSTSLLIPANAKPGDTIHVVCEVNDNGTPSLTRYQRTIITVK